FRYGKKMLLGIFEPREMEVGGEAARIVRFVGRPAVGRFGVRVWYGTIAGAWMCTHVRERTK
ncbi:MAG: hypothetical protein LUD50_04780, partial [Clostridia bacterium]|nr:hypothetical protein [Clostridia bacterium]